MTTVTVSPKFQIVIPKEVRISMHIKAGNKVVMVPFGNVIYLVPMRSLKDLRGKLKGVNTKIIREPDREL